MFIIIKHGAGGEDLFNPDCSLRLLVDNIRKRCCCPPHATVALIDEGAHDSKDIIRPMEQSMENAVSHFKDRRTYILLAVEKREGGPLKYTALLDDIKPELAAMLESLSNPSGPKSEKLPRGRKGAGSSRPPLPSTSKGRRTSSVTKHRGK